MSSMFETVFKDELEAVATIEKPKRGRKAKVKQVETVSKSSEVKENNLTKIKNLKTANFREKFVKSLLKKANLKELPNINDLFKTTESTKVKLKDLAIFISDNPTGILKEVAKEIPLRNTLNLAAEVEEKRVKEVGIRIFESGKIYMAIECAKLTDGSMNLECWSGRHRLAFLALVYGPDAEVPVRITEYTTNEARHAVLIANDARKTLMHEKAQSSYYKAGGDEIDRSVVYDKMAVNKTKAIHYVMAGVLGKKIHGATLKFDVSETSSRADGSLTTGNNLQGYYSNAIEWSKSMQFKEMEDSIKGSTKFLNEVVGELKHQDGFDAKQQLAAQPLKALGSIYIKLSEDIHGTNVSAVDYAKVVAESLVSMGTIGRNRSEEILADLKKRIKKAVSK